MSAEHVFVCDHIEIASRECIGSIKIRVPKVQQQAHSDLRTHAENANDIEDITNADPSVWRASNKTEDSTRESCKSTRYGRESSSRGDTSRSQRKLS